MTTPLVVGPSAHGLLGIAQRTATAAIIKFHELL
jgi:hypothetical protein